MPRLLTLPLPVLAALAVALPSAASAAPPTLTADHRRALAEELRHQGIALGDLATVDRGTDGLDAVLAGVLADPISGLDVAHDLVNPVALDAGATVAARWEGAFGVIAGAWGVEGSVPACGEVATGQPLSSQHVAAAEARGERWSKRAKNDIAQRLDDDLDAILGQLADAAAEAACGVEAAFADADLDDASRARLLREAARLLGEVTTDPGAAEALLGLDVDRGVLLETARRWTAAVDASAQRLVGLDAAAWPTSPLIWTIALGEVWIGSPGANAGAGNPVLLVDPGGDDHWRIRPDTPVDAGSWPAVRGWIDLGGDDVWRGGTFGAGSAAFGVSAGLDLQGDDTHIASSFAAGAAVQGIATWLDAAGRDRYEVREAGLGFGVAGAGILRDLRRDDVYRSDRWAQGAALPGGIGVLHDLRGGDRYLLNDDLAEEREEASQPLLPSCHAGCGQGFAAGLLGVAPGGRGFLLDDVGDDLYSGGHRVQGAAWAGALSVVRDGGGDDRWLAGAHAQGSSERRAFAALLDVDGFDEYSASWRAQGAAGEASVAWLYDRRGRDRYALGTGPGQGEGFASGGAALVLDPDGGDFNLFTRGGKATRRPPIGVTVGAGKPAQVLTGSKADTPRMSVDELVAALAATDGRTSDLERLDAELTSPLRRLGQAERERVVDAVAASARRLKESDAPRHHLDWLVTLTARSPLLAGALDGLATEFTSHRRWPVREAAWNARAALGRIDGLELAPEDAEALATAAAVALQKEAHRDVRAAAARAAGAFGGAGVASSLVDGLLTEHLALRRSCERALLAVAARTDGVAIARGLYGVAGGDEPVDPVLRDAALRVLGATKQREAVAILDAALADDALTALAAAEGLLRHGSRQALAAVAPWREANPDKERWAARLLGD